jgi:HrpA-like RNA helicase
MAELRFDLKSGRRLVCFSTNIAESGVTLPGITVVIDTGRELFFSYDLELHADVITTSWISQASQQQRKGRAGRTAPGALRACSLQFALFPCAPQCKEHYLWSISRWSSVCCCCRGVPGKCICMYTKVDYDAMPPFTVPAVLRSNCESMYLGLVCSCGTVAPSLLLLDL